jgi:ceramide synthetase
MLLHDINDVLLETAKILNYAAFESASTLVFVCFMVSWVVLRICIFPLYIINSCFFEVQVCVCVCVRVCVLVGVVSVKDRN